MKVGLDGFGKYADTLHIDLPKHLDWHSLTGLLNIDGVQYFYTQACTVFIRYSKAADLQDVAAQGLRVIADGLGIPLEELSVGIHDSDVAENAVPELANGIWLRALAASTPEPVPAGSIIPRGIAPAYYLA